MRKNFLFYYRIIGFKYGKIKPFFFCRGGLQTSRRIFFCRLILSAGNTETMNLLFIYFRCFAALSRTAHIHQSFLAIREWKDKSLSHFMSGKKLEERSFLGGKHYCRGTACRAPTINNALRLALRILHHLNSKSTPSVSHRERTDMVSG